MSDSIRGSTEHNSSLGRVLGRQPAIPDAATQTPRLRHEAPPVIIGRDDGGRVTGRPVRRRTENATYQSPVLVLREARRFGMSSKRWMGHSFYQYHACSFSLASPAEKNPCLPQCSEIVLISDSHPRRGLDNHGKPHLALTLPTTVFGTVGDFRDFCQN